MNNLNYPLVSIVFTSYNHQEYLEQALNSLISQSYPNIEIIIVDDCSTDGSQEILKRYAHYKKINLILSDVNSGSYVKASNYGASFATGEYILFAQCDDYAEKNQIEKLVSFIIKNPSVGVVFSKSNLVNEQGVKISDDFFGREKKFKKTVRQKSIISGKEMRRYLSFSCVIPNLSAALLKHELYKEINGLSEQFLVVADWVFWLNLSQTTNFGYIFQPLNNFRQHATTIRSNIKMKTQIVEIYAMFYNHLNQYKLTEKEKYNIKVGAGAVWFSYFFQDKKTWLKSFLSIYSEINKFEKIPLFYFFIGVKRHVFESINRKINKNEKQ